MPDHIKAFLIEVYMFLAGHGHNRAAIDVADFLDEQEVES